MPVTKLLFNNIKEFTPKCFRTINAKMAVKPYFNKGPYQAWKMNKTPFVVKLWRGFNRTFYFHMHMQFVLYFLAMFAITETFWRPWLSIYQFNNRHRQLEKAIEIEKEYQRKKQEEEDAEEDEDDDEEEGEDEE